MILDLVWAAAIVGGLAAVVQMIRPRHLDLRPLVFGCLALVALLGLMGLGWHGAQVMQLWAHAQAPHAHVDPATLDVQTAAVQALLGATGLAGVAVALLGGVAVMVRTIAARRAAST